MGRKFADWYVQGKYGKGYREINDTQTEYLYSKGQYATKIRIQDLPKDYIKVFSRYFNYTDGYVRTKGVVDIDYSYVKENHLFKDDYLYLTYHGKLYEEISRMGFKSIEGYDICVCGSDLIKLLYAVERNTPELDTTHVRRKIQEKINYLWSKEPDYYKTCFHTDRYISNIFAYFEQNGYCD